MLSRNRDICMFAERAECDPSLNWYAIADSAQHRALPGALVHDGHSVRCLFNSPQNSPLAQKSPHLVALCSPLNDSVSWAWIAMNGSSKPCLTVIATSMDFDTLFLQLRQCIEVVLPDSFVMFFGFWDPAILGTLMGQAGDRTLHVEGPVLNSDQRKMLTSGLSGWWYWDRTGQMHALSVSPATSIEYAGALSLTQQQVDQLVEASLPDHLLYYLELNQPFLIADIQSQERYHLVRQALVRARYIGLDSMQDLLNFICVDLLYGDRMRTDRAIVELLDRVRHGGMTFAQAVTQLPA